MSRARFDGKKIVISIGALLGELTAREARDLRAELAIAITEADIEQPASMLRDALRGRILTRAQSETLMERLRKEVGSVTERKY
jgi:hypothetical protein